MPHKKNHYINREISWLSFNARVLQEAADPTVPLIERLKFLGIFSSNLDEFFRVRVGTLMRLQRAGVKAKATFGKSPKKILNEIHDVVVAQRATFDKVFSKLYQELEKENIFIINEKQLNKQHEEFVGNYFRQEVRPRLAPTMLDSLPEFPDLTNQVIYLAIHLSHKNDNKKVKYALIEVPVDVLPRFVVLPGVRTPKYIIMLDDIIRYSLKQIFYIFDFDTIAAYTIKLTRDAEIDIEDDITKSDFEKISKSIKQRQKGKPVRFVYDRKMPEDLLQFILERNNLKNFDNVIPGGRYHNAKDFMTFPHVGLPRLEHEKRPVLQHPKIESFHSLFTAIHEHDILLHYPYQSFHYVTDLLREAAIDPQVVSIKMTLYRVAKNSNVVNALINAIQNGKKVAVLLELQARFDEEANIYWTERLEEAGAHLIDIMPGFKVHSKLCLITRQEGNKPVNYAIIGTGNFNEATAKIYCDHALFTADKRLTDEVAKVFAFLENKLKVHTYKHLVVSPFYMRKKFAKLIKNEIKNARAEKKAYIYAKMNSLVDRQMINRLYEAGQAGVKIRLIVRGICSLVPGVEGLSENIQVISIVDKYLEHSRIFIFCNGGDEKYFISSADWMVRNLDNRIEVAAPIYDSAIQKELKQFFKIQWHDTAKARILNSEQDNILRQNNAGSSHRAQDQLFEFLSSGNVPEIADELV